MAMSTMRQAPAGSDDQDPLRALLKQAQQLFPSWQDPRKFHEGKSSLIAGLRQLIDSGDGAPGRRRARTSAPPTPAPEPLPRRRQPVVAPASAPPSSASPVRTETCSASFAWHSISMRISRSQRSNYQKCVRIVRLTRFRIWPLGTRMRYWRCSRTGLTISWAPAPAVRLLTKWPTNFEQEAN